MSHDSHLRQNSQASGASILASILAYGAENLPPATNKLLDAAPDSFPDPREGIAAVAIRNLRDANESVNFASVVAGIGNRFEDVRSFIATLLPDAMPLEIVESEAEQLLRSFKRRKIARTFADAGAAVEVVPDNQLDSIVAHTVAALEPLCGDAAGNPVAIPWVDAGRAASEADIVLGPGRWGTRGSAFLVTAFTGSGKSTLSSTMSFSWAIGRESLGIQPAGRLRSLVFQAEDDAGDLDTMAKSILRELNPDAAELQAIRENVLLVTEGSVTGINFLQKRVAPALAKYHPDILWLNPLSTYFGSDLNDQREVAHFCRNTLNPLLLKHRCLCITIHHCPKPTKERNGWSGGQLAYSGAGSADLANWAREVITLREASRGLFELTATKRWRKLGWTDAEGRPTATRQIAQDQNGGQVWHDATPQLLEELGAGRYSDAGFMALVPDAGIDRAELLRLAAETFSVTERTAAKFVKDARRACRRTVNGRPLRCKLLDEAQRPRREVYPESPSGRPVVWLTKAIVNETADEELMK